MSIMPNLTPLEVLVMNTLITNVADFDREHIFKMALGLEEYDKLFEGNVNETEIEELADVCGATINEIKGVLGSLSKKGYVWIVEDDEMICPTMDGVKALIADAKALSSR